LGSAQGPRQAFDKIRFGLVCEGIDVEFTDSTVTGVFAAVFLRTYAPEIVYGFQGDPLYRVDANVRPALTHSSSI